MLELPEIMTTLGSLAISLVVLVPLIGTGVRFRAHYNPKGLRLDPENQEGEVYLNTSPVISSFFGMLRRVQKLEGFSGLYKGLMPLLIILILKAMVSLSYINLRHRIYIGTDAGAVDMLVYSILVELVFLPLVIIMIRAITTPHKLPRFNAMYSLRILLTTTERRRPWILYLTPGLLAAQVMHTTYDVIFLWLIQRLLNFPELTNPGLPRNNEIPPVEIVLLIAAAILSKFILAPLEVIATRLSIQQNHRTPELQSILQEEGGDCEEVTDTGADEDVVALRTDREPYVGLVDCAKRIIDEEGWSTLYRAWWLTTF